MLFVKLLPYFAAIKTHFFSIKKCPINRRSVTEEISLGCGRSVTSPVTSDSEPLKEKQGQCFKIKWIPFCAKLFIQLDINFSRLLVMKISSYNGGIRIQQYDKQYHMLSPTRNSTLSMYPHLHVSNLKLVLHPGLWWSRHDSWGFQAAIMFGFSGIIQLTSLLIITFKIVTINLVYLHGIWWIYHDQSGLHAEICYSVGKTGDSEEGYKVEGKKNYFSSTFRGGGRFIISEIHFTRKNIKTYVSEIYLNIIYQRHNHLYFLTTTFPKGMQFSISHFFFRK